VATFRIVPGSSSIDTEVGSSVHPIHGTTNQVSGEVRAAFDGEGNPQLDQPHGGWAEIPVESIKSGSRLQDMEMARRAEVGRYPSIRFEVEKAWLEDGSGYRAAVSVTAHGQTRRIEEPFAFKLDGRRLVLEGEHTFDMRDFGVKPPRIFTLKVDPEVKVRVRLVADELG
jgi:polyisoprenoid-binding protein YceI